MKDELQDMRSPEGWAIITKEGRFGDASAPEFVPLATGRVWVPREFSMVVRDDAARLAVLRFEVRDSYPTLIEALASEELTSVLNSLTHKRSIDWWKRKAIHDMTSTSIAAFDDEVLQRAALQADHEGMIHGENGETIDLQTIASMLQNAREAAVRAPMRRPRRKVTDDRLDDIAARYTAAEARGSRTPTRDVWEEINVGKSGNEILSKDRVRHLVSEARAKGKLPPAKTGPRAARVL